MVSFLIQTAQAGDPNAQPDVGEGGDVGAEMQGLEGDMDLSGDTGISGDINMSLSGGGGGGGAGAPGAGLGPNASPF